MLSDVTQCCVHFKNYTVNSEGKTYIYETCVVKCKKKKVNGIRIRSY